MRFTIVAANCCCYCVVAFKPHDMVNHLKYFLRKRSNSNNIFDNTAMNVLNAKLADRLSSDDNPDDPGHSSALELVEESANVPLRQERNDNDVVVPTSSATQTTNNSYDGDSNSKLKELLCTVSVLVLLGIPLWVSSLELNERPIPYQKLDSGEYVRNLSNNEILEYETVPDTWLLIISVFLPFIVQILLSKFLGQMGDVSSTGCVYLTALFLTSLTTEYVKRYVGYLRPIFYDICQPNDDYTECTNNADSESFRKSFPSGHASLSFCGLTLLTLYLHNRFGLPSIQALRLVPAINTHTEDAESRTSLTGNTTTQHQVQQQTIIIAFTKEPFRYRMISLLSLIPMGVALFVAVSRVHDNKHFPADVVGGSLLGASIAIFIHGLWL